MQQLFESNDISINTLPSFQYRMDCPQKSWPKRKRTEWSQLILSHWITDEHGSAPKNLFIGRWTTGGTLFTLIGWWIHHMNIHLSYVLHGVIGKLWTSSQQLEIEVGRYAQIPLEERICHLCHQGLDFEEHYVCHWCFLWNKRETQFSL